MLCDLIPSECNLSRVGFAIMQTTVLFCPWTCLGWGGGLSHMSCHWSCHKFCSCLGVPLHVKNPVQGYPLPWTGQRIPPDRTGGSPRKGVLTWTGHTADGTPHAVKEGERDFLFNFQIKI